MNVYKIGDFYKFELYNVSFFGRGRNPEPFNVSGHYTVLLAIDLSKFLFYKHADYGGLTWVNKVELLNENWTDYELSFMNDEILQYLPRSGYKYFEYNIGDASFMDETIKENILIWNTFNKYDFNNKITGLSPRLGDKIHDIAANDIFEFHYGIPNYYLRQIMINENNNFPIIERKIGVYSIEEFKKHTF